MKRAGKVSDIAAVVMGKIPQPPAGFEIAGIDVMVHLRRKPD